MDPLVPPDRGRDDADRRGVDVLAIATLVAALLVTAVVTVWRSQAVADAEQVAVDVAEDHFLAVVAGTEVRARDAAAEIRVATRGMAATGVPQNVDALDAALLRYQVASQPGFIGAIAWPDSRLGVATEAWPERLRRVRNATADLGSDEVRVVSTDDGIVVVSGSPTGSIGLLYDPSSFLLGPEHENPWVTTSIELVDDAPAAGRVAPTDGPGGSAVEWRSSSSGGGTRFTSEANLDLLGARWSATVQTEDGFVEIPVSREVPLLAAGGSAFAFGAYVLVRELRRRRDEAERRSETSAERFAVGFSQSPIGVLEVNEELRLVSLNDAAEELFGRSAADMLSRNVVDFFHEESRAAARQQLIAARSGSVSADGIDLRLRRPYGRFFPWVRMTLAPISSEDGGQGVLMQLIDVTEQRETQAELEQRAMHDDLTGLPNRALLLDRLDFALEWCRTSSRSAAALFIDLDGFKQVNDAHGHGAGDELLQEVARRLCSVARSTDTVARFGGDEFLVLCPDLERPEHAVGLADRLRSSLDEPIAVGSELVRITMSIGISVAGPDDTAEAVVRDADLALYEAKAQGRDQAVAFEPGMRAALLQRLDREDALRRACEHGELMVYFQPVLDVDLGALVGFEALVRWAHPEEGVVPPGEFLPLASRLGLLPVIDRFVLETAVREIKRCSGELRRPLTVAVNASSDTIADPTYPEFVAGALSREQVEARQLVVEVTEEEVIDVDRATPVIRQLRELGVLVAIDDFGTGQSSFAQVAALQFDVLKIDRTFIQQARAPRGEQIVRTLVDMGRAMGVRTVAEGVETDLDLEMVQRLGCNMAQGFLIGRPGPASAVPDSVRSNPL